MRADVSIRLATDEDMLEFESFLDDGKGAGFWPRTDKMGKPLRSWERYHQNAMNELDRAFRAKKNVAETFEFGLLDLRSQARLKDAAVYFALHFLFVDANRSGDDFYERKAEMYFKKAYSVIDAESLQLDYDADRSGNIDTMEQNQPFPSRFIRG